jgi:hypothetical protein
MDAQLGAALLEEGRASRVEGNECKGYETNDG